MFNKIKYLLIDSYHRPSAKILHIFVFFKSLFFNYKTKIFSEKMFLLKSPPNSMIYLNFFGRISYLILNFFMILLFNRFLNKNTFIDDGINQDRIPSEQEGNDETPWPPQSLKFFEPKNPKLNKEFIDLLEKNYNYSLELISGKKNFEESDWWKTCRAEYKREFLNNNSLNIEALENFRSKTNTRSAIISDLYFLNSNNKLNKIKSLSLINLYHKISEYIELEVLRQASESYVGKNICLNYRNQRLSHTVLRHAYFVSQILKFAKLDFNKKNIIVDIGGGYGGLARLLKHFSNKSTLIIFEVPEATILAAYFLKKNFPNAKIGHAIDFQDIDQINEDLIRQYDFIILPEPNIEKISDDTVDLCINTISLGEMTNNTQDNYLKNIERITKDYFYSVNRPKKRLKYNAQGFYNLKFKKRWKTKLYNFSYTYHVEFLGKKIKD